MMLLVLCALVSVSPFPGQQISTKVGSCEHAGAAARSEVRGAAPPLLLPRARSLLLSPLSLGALARLSVDHVHRRLDRCSVNQPLEPLESERGVARLRQPRRMDGSRAARARTRALLRVVGGQARSPGCASHRSGGGARWRRARLERRRARRAARSRCSGAPSARGRRAGAPWSPHCSHSALQARWSVRARC